VTREAKRKCTLSIKPPSDKRIRKATGTQRRSKTRKGLFIHYKECDEPRSVAYMIRKQAARSNNEVEEGKAEREVK
jgi:hypothetical protein